MNAVFSRVPANPRICDLQTGFAILARLPLADSEEAVLIVSRLLDGLIKAPPAAEVYLQLLEQTRISLCFIAEDLARRYTARPLPLANLEEEAFRQVVANWRKAARAYAHCARLLTPDTSTAYAERVALILHRCIHYTGMAIAEHQRARQELPAGLWLDLHGYYASAEEWGVATFPVPDSLDSHGRSTHCTAEFVSLLLVELASPRSLSLRQLTLVRRWAHEWAPLVGVHPLQGDADGPPLVIDLMHDSGAHSVSEAGSRENLRRLDCSLLATQIAQVRTRLQQKISPAQLGLGEDCTAAECHHLLGRLHKPWGLLRMGRRFRRHGASGQSKVCYGFPGVHFHVSGREFSQPGIARAYSRDEFESLYAFRHMVDPTQLLEVRQVQLGVKLDSWEVLDQCANGFRLLRSSAGRKVETGQLISICPYDGSAHLLARVVWLMQEKDGALQAGVSALPGKPQAVAVRTPQGEPGHTDEYSRAFLLPALPAICEEATLVLPRGWYHSDRVLEVFVDGPCRVRLQRLVDEGADFERVSFIPA
ncbi:hypothetical protein [Accumulibacter sp.]|uniref:hypothetical protein n=1 Tax=Accumulibacter sp. TaxID=2053492 RepID=UPI0025FDCA70|nr:hypothetical protein [Accumulibacter sp.]MCM8595289.1 hypothetical protein [Accumulibacter sp.]MCM8625256.1 hypothetical protein [Accumulibacter sp.]MDS4049435.1 hypothetical protein [Accumulibacter sp.]